MKTINKNIKTEKTKNLINLILCIFMLFAVLLAFSLVFAADEHEQNFDADKVKHIEYDFDEVNVLYAVQFEASPETNQARSGELKQDEWYSANKTWLMNLVTDTNPNITVIFGVVELKNKGIVTQKEGFIKIIGEKGSRRFLANSESISYYELTNNLREVYSLFWSAKKLEGNKVIKDFTEPIDSVIFRRKCLPSGECTNFYLSFFTGSQNFIMDVFNSENHPIMYSLYKTIAEFGVSDATIEDNANAGKIYTRENNANDTKDTNNITVGNNNTANITNVNNTGVGENITTGNNTTVGSSNLTTNTTTNTTTAGNTTTANTTPGNNATSGSNNNTTSTGTNNITTTNTTSESNNKTANNTTTTGNTTTANTTSGSNNTTANNTDTAGNNTTAGSSNTTANNCTENTTSTCTTGNNTNTGGNTTTAEDAIVKG